MNDTPEAVVEAFGADAERAQRAATNRAEFEKLIRGAVARSAMLPRHLIRDLGFAVTDLMLMEIVTGRLKPKTPKEAIEVAKAAQEIARKEAGEADTTIVIRTPEERAKAQARIAELQASVMERAALPAPRPAEPELPVIDVEEIDPDLVAGASIPRSLAATVALPIVPG